jgi:hypothetical protein
MRPTGGLAVTAAGVAMIVAVLALSRAGVPADPLADAGTAVRTDLSTTKLGETASVDQAEAPARQLVETEAETVAHHELAHPFEFELSCTVLEHYGLPVQGVQVLFAPFGCSLNLWPLPTQSDGTTVLRWRGKQPSMQMAICIREPGPQQDRSVDALQLVQAHASAKQHIAFLVGGPLPGKQPGQQGALGQLVHAAAVQGKAANGCEFASQRRDCTTCHEQPGALAATRKLHARSGLHPEANFVDRLLTRHVPVPVDPSATATNRFLAASFAQHLAGREQDVAKLLAESWVQTGARIEVATTNQTLLARAGFVRGIARSNGLQQAGLALEARMVGGSLTLSLRQPPATPTTGRIAGRVFASDGRTAAGVMVVISRDSTQPEQSTTTDARGAYSFDHIPPGTVHVRAGGRDEGLALHSVQVAAGSTTPADLSLSRGAAITGRAFGADGTPLRGWRVEFVATHEPWIGACETREDGRFDLPNPPGSGRLMLFAPDGPRLPVAVEPFVLPGAGDVLFDLRATGEAKGALLVGVRCPVGVVAPEARIWQLESGRGVSIPNAKAGAFLLQGLAAGSYRVEVGADGSGWQDLGTHWVDGKNQTNLGVVEASQPCHVSIVEAEQSRPVRRMAVEIYRRRPDCDVRADGVKLDAAGVLLLPPGDWLLLWPQAGGQIGLRTFACRGGDAIEVPLARDASGSPAAISAK